MKPLSKRMNKILITILILLLMLLFSYILRRPKIFVTTKNNTPIHYYLKKDKNDDFKKIMNGIDFLEELVYIKANEELFIEMEDKKLDSIFISDKLIDMNGESIYDKKLDNIEVLEFTNGKFIYYIKPHIASSLSSNISSYDLGNTIRGIEIIYTIGKKEYVYLLVIRTDAN